MIEVNSQLFLKFIDFIYKNSGIRFDSKNEIVLKGRIIDAIRELEINTPEELYEIIVTNQEKKNYFLDLVTTNLTQFFRNALHFETFENFVIPQILEIKKKENKSKIVLWSAGCSTGEEPYSLAFVLKSLLPKSFDFLVIASDLSLKSLMIAKEGYYSAEKCKNIPKEYMSYMEPYLDGYKVSNEIKKHIRFDYHNLKNNHMLSNVDILFCRNVLIYFDEESRKEVLKKFYNSMSEHSYLFIGHSESLFGMNLPFKFVKTDSAVIYEKNEKPKAISNKKRFINKYNL